MAERKRRQYGSGSIYQRASDGRWLGVIQAGWNTDGGRRTITVSAKTEAEAKRRLRDKQLELDRTGIAAVTSRATVKTWANQWLVHEAARLRPKAYSATRSAITKWVIPTIGAKRLDALTPADIRAVAAAMRAAGRAPSSILRAHTDLVSMLRDALVEGHPVPPRVLLVDRPHSGGNDRTAIPAADAAKMLATAVDLGMPQVSRWVAAFLQGLRRGEALGLTRDRDLGDRLDISWQLQALPYNIARDRASGFRVPDGFEARHLRDAYHLIRPKTAHGQRIIPIVPWFRAALDQWYEVAPESPYGLVWPALDGGPANEATDLEEFKALQDAADVRHPSGRFYVGHETRHTTATLLLEARVDRAVIEAIVGHSRLVETYLHAPTSMAADALEQIATRLQLG